MFKIAIVDDHPILRRGIADVLSKDSSFNLVSNLGDSHNLMTVLDKVRPEILLLNLNMPEQDGIQILRQIKAANIETKVVLFTGSNAANDVHQAIRSGADGYLLKSIEPEQLILKLKQCLRGERVYSESIEALVTQAHNSRSPEGRHPILSELTDRELDVLHLIAEGMTNKAIGERLAIAEGTVKVHVKRLLAKLNLRSRVEAAIFALEHTQDI